MNAQPPPDLPGPWPDLLAAYADGELDAATRAVVERWLAAHPGACREVRDQRQLSPENWALWQQAEPPLPTEATWAKVRDAVANAVLPAATPAPRREWNWWARNSIYFTGGVAAAVAAMLLLCVLGPVLAPPPKHPVPVDQKLQELAEQTPPADPLAEYPVLPVATADDVDIRRVAGDTGGWLVVGELPLAGPVVLATEDDVALEEAEPHPAWPTGTPRMTTGRGDAPMIFAATPR
jgi:anti-sigma factor RsiW